jgi:hypothetical protein
VLAGQYSFGMDCTTICTVCTKRRVIFFLRTGRCSGDLTVKNFDTGLSRKALASVMVACLITVGVFAAAIYLPGFPGGPTGPTNPSASLGAQVAAYLISRADDVEFYWMSNCTLVNEDLTAYYNAQHAGAFVDGVYVNRSGSNHEIVVLFSPYDVAPVGRGNISVDDWTMITASIIDNGIAKMEGAGSEAPEETPSAFPLELYFSIFFNDDTCFLAGFSNTDGYMWMHNGTWSGGFESNGHPEVTSWDFNPIFLLEGGHLAAATVYLHDAVTSAVSYP